MTEALEQAIGGGSTQSAHEVDLPLIRTGEPGSLKLTNAEIEDLLT